jgi:hypothetical protein
MINIAKIFPFPFTCIVGLAALTATYAQVGRGYSSPNFSSKANNKAWSKMKEPLYASFVNKDVYFHKRKAPDVPEVTSWGETCWRGERLGTQLLLWSGTGVSEVELHVSDLETSSGQTIDAKYCTVGFIGYVMSDEFGADGCSPRSSKNFDSVLVADVIEYKKTVRIQKNTVQPVWFSLNVHPETATGKYKGFITVTAKELPNPVTLTINVFVRNHLLPPASQWSFYLDMWQNPVAVARYHNVAPWGKEHFNAMRPAMTKLAQSGQKSITIPITNNAIEGALPSDFESMLTLTRRVDNAWSVDFTKFDLWVEFMMSLGVNKELCCYVSGRQIQTISYFDQASNSVKVQEISADSKEYGDYLNNMLGLLTEHLKAKGWFDKATICMNESGKERLRKLTTIAAKIDTCYKVNYTGAYFADVERLVSRYSIAPRHVVAATQRKAGSREGRLLCIYSPCSDAQPNTYTFSPSAEAAWLSWYAANNGLDGYTRQAYNSWEKRALQDTRSASHAAGYQWLVYPEGRSSLRMERLVEGIQDYEKVKILMRNFNQVNNVISREKLRTTLSSFTLENLKTKPAEKMVEEARIVLNSL